MHFAKIGTGALFLSAALNAVWAQCTAPTSTQWTRTDLATTLNHPDAMSILADGRVFISEMWSGSVKLVTPPNTVTEVLKLTTNFYADKVENGLLGVAADPGFATNNWVYIFYSRKTPGSTYSAGDGGVNPHEHVLARYTLSGGKLINPKEMLTYKRLTKRHSAGGMTFNKATGDLYITTGDDTYPGSNLTQWGGRQENADHLNSLLTAANTNDLRGKVLRIKPIPFADTESPGPGVNKSYTIPAGNLYPENTDKTRPEIYTMGHRNPYKIKVDDVSGYALIGEVGPDATSNDAAKGPIGYEEFNLIRNKSGFYGWPFAVADNLVYTAIAGEAYPVGTKFDVNNLKNLSKLNTGLETMPVAIGAIGHYSSSGVTNDIMKPFATGGGETAISGPYYRYDAANANAGRLPAFFHGKFIVGEFSRNRLWALEMTSAGGIAKVTEIRTVTKPIDMDIGPKGELYVLEYGNSNGYEGDDNTGKLYKLEFNGAQYAASGCSQYVFPPATVGIARSRGPAGRTGYARMMVNPALMRQVAAPAGANKGILFGLNGEKTWEGPIQAGRLHFPSELKHGLGFLHFE